MTGQKIDLDTWPRTTQFRFFRGFERPHYAVTARVDVTALMAARKTGISPFRHALWAIGTGLHAVPELRMRFVDDTVTVYDSLLLSPTIAMESGDFRFTYLDYSPERATFDAHAETEIAAVRNASAFNPNDWTAEDAVAYCSCLPWLDYTSLDNALPTASDCIPRISWGKIVPKGKGHDMAMTIQVHHALVDGRHVGAYFEAVQNALSSIDP